MKLSGTEQRQQQAELLPQHAAGVVQLEHSLPGQAATTMNRKEADAMMPRLAKPPDRDRYIKQWKRQMQN